jgi:hypothetical protein
MNMKRKKKKRTSPNPDRWCQIPAVMYRFACLFLVLLPLLSCHRQPELTPQAPMASRYNDSVIIHALRLLKDGDLILRTGDDFISQSLRRFSLKDPTYSHSGLAQQVRGRFLVYHAIGGEDNPAQTLRRDSFGYFCDPDYNLGFAVYRYDLDPPQILKLDSMEKFFYARKTKFDLDFDLHTDDRLYCTEFIYKSLVRATGDARYIPLTSFIGRTYVSTDNLFLNKHARLVYRAIFR